MEKINETLFGIIHDDEVALPLMLDIANDYEAIEYVFADRKIDVNTLEEMDAFVKARRKYREANNNDKRGCLIYKDDNITIYKRKNNPPEYVKVEYDPKDYDNRKLYIVSHGHLYRSKLIEEQLKLEGF